MSDFTYIFFWRHQFDFSSASQQYIYKWMWVIMLNLSMHHSTCCIQRIALRSYCSNNSIFVCMNKQIENSRFTAYILQLVIVTLFVCSYLFTDRIFRNDLKYFTHTHTHTRKWYRDITFVYLYGKKISVVIKNTAYSNDLSRFYYVFTTVSNTTFSTSHNILNILFFPCPAG